MFLAQGLGYIIHHIRQDGLICIWHTNREQASIKDMLTYNSIVNMLIREQINLIS